MVWYLLQDLDEAVLDRMDDALLFPIPDKKSRAQLLVQVRVYTTDQQTKTSR